jgi:hypothetical protein
MDTGIFPLKRTFYFIIAVSLLLSAGLYSPENVFAQIDGVKTIRIDTDSSWKSLDTEVRGWTSAEFDDSWWLDSWEASTPIPDLSQAKAIWYPDEPEPPIVYFRKTIHLDDAEVVSGRIAIRGYRSPSWSGDIIEIYANQQFIGKVTMASLYYGDTKHFDIAPFLTEGENVIAVKVTFTVRDKKPQDYWGLSGEIRYTAKSLVESSTLNPVQTPSQQSVPEPGQPYVDLYGQLTDVTVGDEIIAYLSVVNPITSPGTLVIQLTLRTPSGWSITSSGFGHAVGGMSTNTYEIEQGPNIQAIQVQILANEAYEGELVGYIDYYYKNTDKKYQTETRLPVKASPVGKLAESTERSSTLPENTDKEGMSGVTVAIIIGLFAVSVGGLFTGLILRRANRTATRKGNLSDNLPPPLADERRRPHEEGRGKELDPNRTPTEMVLDIKEGQKGISYERLFSPYVRNATLVKIYDPWIKSAHQIYNLINFCEILNTPGKMIKVRLVTARDDASESQQEKKLNDIKKGLLQDNIEFDYTFDDKQHDRWLETDTGWRIILGRGLDIFQARAHYYGRGFSDQTKRKCRATAITYTRTARQMSTN